MMMHMPGTDNPADILSKHWAHQAVYPILKLILFFLGIQLILFKKVDSI
jgi:hypothetical protein